MSILTYFQPALPLFVSYTMVRASEFVIGDQNLTNEMILLILFSVLSYFIMQRLMQQTQKRSIKTVTIQRQDLNGSEHFEQGGTIILSKTSGGQFR